MDESIKKAFDTLGLRTYDDPEAKRRANEEEDLSLKLTIRTALFLNATIQLMISICQSNAEDARRFADGFYELYPEGPERDFLRTTLQSMQIELFKEIYRKQREIYSEVDH